MRLVRFVGAAALLLSIAGVSSAAPIQNGSSILAFQFTQGKVDLAQPSAGYLTSFPSAPNEIGFQVQYWKFLREEYAFNLQGGVGMYSEKDESSDPLDPEVKYTQSSWQVRVGGDRVAHINDRFHIFVGPGIQYWTGKWKVESGGTEFESEATKRLALNGRIAVHLKMGQNFGMVGIFGHYFGYAWAADGDAKTHWWATGTDGSGGLAFNF